MALDAEKIMDYISIRDQSISFPLYVYHSVLQIAEFGLIMMAIDNIAEKCRRTLDAPVTNMSLEDKLEHIKVNMQISTEQIHQILNI